MDEDEEYASEREELLNRFRDSLSKPVSERFFDEDDLIEIFDYAGDLNDDYLRLEALLCGARFFPESEALLARKGIFCSQYSDEVRNSFMSTAQPKDNFILKILSLRSTPPAQEKEIETLDALIGRQESMNDEEAIQFLALVGALKRLDWLKEHIDVLRQKVQYVNVLLYEASNIAESLQDYDFAILMMDELTEIEPFNSFYWTSLARICTEKGDYDRALNSIDYALAINPDSALPLLGKAKLYYAMQKPLHEVETLARQAVEASDGDLDCIRFLANVLFESNQSDKAEEVLRNAIYQNATADSSVLTPEEKYRAIELIPEMILARPDDIDALLDRFYFSNEENPQVMWASWAQQLSSQGFGDIARNIIECYQRNSGVQLVTNFVIEDAFIHQEFHKVLDKLEEYIKPLGGREIDFPVLLSMHLISLVKLGQFAQATALCNLILERVNADKHTALCVRIELQGLLSLIEKIKNKISESTDPKDWADFDPLDCWSK